MNKIIFSFFLLLLSINANSQGIVTRQKQTETSHPSTEKAEDINKTHARRPVKVATDTIVEDLTVYFAPDSVASFPQEEGDVLLWISSRIVYPKRCKENEIQGVVILGFTVNKDGSLQDIIIKDSPDEDFSFEAIRLVKEMPKWNPAIVDGKKVRSYFTLPVQFKIEYPDRSGKDDNGYEYVDLALPSGTLWATCNIGADSPIDYGEYYMWGATEQPKMYTWYYDKFVNRRSAKYIKYCTLEEGGKVDGIVELELSDDVANKKRHGNWRIPSREQMNELLSSQNVSIEWEEQDGVIGEKITSKRNGNSIFLPAGGRRDNSNLKKFEFKGTLCAYWSRTLDEKNPWQAYGLLNSDNRIGALLRESSDRSVGMAIRPVLNN